MPSKNKQKHVYDPEMMRILTNISLPPKIKCALCQHHRTQAQYSNKQLSDAKYAIKLNGPTASYKIRCRFCIEKQLVEIECTVCGDTKGLEEFAKIQRRKPDSAKCYACMDKQLELIPVEDEVYEDPRRAYIPVESSAGNYPEYWSAQSTAHSNASVADASEADGSDNEDGGISLRDLKKMALNDTPTGTLIETDGSLTYHNNGGPVNSGHDGWTVAKSSSWHTKSTATKSESTGVFDIHKYSKPPGRVGSVSGASRTFSTNVTEQSDNTQYKNGWAKIKAYKAPTQSVVEDDDDWKSESEDDDGDDDDDSDVDI